MKIAKKSIAILLALIMSVTCFSLIAFAEEPAVQAHLAEVPEGYVGIYTKDDLDNIKLDMTGKYILMNDIVFNDSDYEKGGSFYNSGKGWEPIGTSSTKFTGILDGNGYKIKNLYINTPEQNYIGLFGYVYDAKIKNITLDDINITGFEYVGGIIGYSGSESIITKCSTQGKVTGKTFVGGVVGYQCAYVNSETKTKRNYIQYCNNAATVIADSYAGGIVGRSHSNYYHTYSANYPHVTYVTKCSNSGQVFSNSYAGGIIGESIGFDNSNYRQYTTYCYNIGKISATSYTGGLIGDAYGSTVKHCYSVGNTTATADFGACFGTVPSSVTFCYYLDEAVVNPTCTAGTPKSEDQLKKAIAFEQWDFDTVWTMGGREDYPYPELIDVPLVLPEDYSAHEHSYTSAITKEATHTETGVITYTCACGDSYTEEIAKTIGHSYTSTITEEATHITTGTMTYTCACGDSYTEVIEKIADHEYNEVVTAPTCEKQGYTTYTCECGYSYIGNYINPTGHSYETEVVAPICTEQGYTTYTCNCGYSYVANYVNPLGHKYESVVTAPTCTEQGYTTFTCGNCGDTYTEDVEALGHGYTSEITTPATHLTEGVETFTCECGDTYTEVIAKITEHTYNAVITLPTCEDEGYTTYTCECGDSYKSDYTSANGHTSTTPVEENYVAPTCTENGSKDMVVYCSICDEEISRETVTLEATGHSDNDGNGYCDDCNELLDPTVECDCSCHKSGITKFFFNFILFFQKLFGSNKDCACGIAHY
mgnify:CR=1 FL=1